MVVLNVKKSDSDQFLFETTCSETNEFLIQQLVTINNIRVRLRCLVGAARQLVEFGPMKPVAEQGLDEIKEEHEGVTILKGEFYKPDPTGLRTGNGVGPQLRETMERVCLDAEAAINAEQVRRRIPTTMELLQEKLDNIRGATMMAFPMGLPVWDTVSLLIEGTEGLDGSQGDGPPAREAAVNEEERKAMMAFYFKKQEEMKKTRRSRR